MPGRNTLKVYVPDSYYHLYNRGWNLTEIFLDDEDYRFFEHLLARHLSPEIAKDRKGREYAHHYELVHLNAYCLMPNHFHLLVYQTNEEGIKKLASSLLTAYTMYFNKKYKRRGPLFENTYKAVRIENDVQLMHITRYIHLNHRKYRTWESSSYSDYLNAPREWVDSNPILELFASKSAYEEFVNDYEETQRTRDAIKADMANG
jgi:putative transposase